MCQALYSAPPILHPNYWEEHTLVTWTDTVQILASQF